MENSVEGSVNATLDALAFETDDVTIVGEVVRDLFLGRPPPVDVRPLAVDRFYQGRDRYEHNIV